MITKEFELCTMNVDCFDHLTIESILDMTATSAGRDANQYHAGFNDFYEAGCYWVLAKVRFNVLSFPNPESKIAITTWPRKTDRNLVAYRDFIIKDEAGHIIIKGQSVWCVIDINNRKICRFPALLNRMPTQEDAVIDEPWGRIPDPVNPTVVQHTVKFCDCDHNGHMNNAQYARAIWNALALKDEVVKSFYIQFEHECHLGDTLTLEIEKDDHHYIIYGKDGDQVAIKAELYTQ